MNESRLCLYYLREAERDRWVPGDRYLRPLVRRLVRGRPRMGGVDKVFHNLCLGLDRIGIPYTINLPFKDLRDTDRVGVLGRGRNALRGYDRCNPIVAGIGLMTHPSEWPTLCRDYPVVRYLQHSEWAAAVYRPYYRDRVGVWPVGIDTNEWRPSQSERDIDFLIYDKVYWNRGERELDLLQPLQVELERRGFRTAWIRYGCYHPQQYRKLLSRSRAMLFLSSHESQGLAYQESLASGVPVLAWNQGQCLDPNRFKWGQPHIPASSVPYFDARCGETFTDIAEFSQKLELFWHRLRTGILNPRGYILEQLTLEKCSEAFTRFFEN